MLAAAQWHTVSFCIFIKFMVFFKMFITIMFPLKAFF